MNTIKLHLLVRYCLIRAKKMASLAALMLATIASLLMPSLAFAITGGSSSSVPWVVQTMALTNDAKQSCTGSALDDLMILTAKHCPVNTVVYPDGSVVPVASTHPVPGSDIKVLILKYSHPLNNYPTLGPNFRTERSSIPDGMVGTFYGYGIVFNGPQKKLRMHSEFHGKLPEEATVEVIYMAERNGKTESGDSGGPLLLDDLLVGVLNGQGVVADDGRSVSVFHGLSNAFSVIRQLQHAREMRAITAEKYFPGLWISAVDVNGGKLAVTMSSQLMNSGKNVVIWVNGKYVGRVKNAIAYQANNKRVTGGAIIDFDRPLRDGDLIQIGVGSETNTPQASELLFERRLNGIEAVMLQNGKAVVRVSPTLFNSGQRVIIWLNGAYHSETYKNDVYYGEGLAKAAGGVTITVGAAAPETYVQIGIVNGTPGDGFGKPAASKLLYNARLDGMPRKVVMPEPSYTIVGQ